MPTIQEEDETEPDTTKLQCNGHCIIYSFVCLSLLVFPMEERDQLLKQISDLKAEIEDVKTNMVVTPPSDSLLRGEETKDIVREFVIGWSLLPWRSLTGESTRLVSEYKNKLQLSEAENTRLEGTVR